MARSIPQDESASFSLFEVPFLGAETFDLCFEGVRRNEDERRVLSQILKAIIILVYLLSTIGSSPGFLQTHLLLPFSFLYRWKLIGALESLLVANNVASNFIC